MKYFSEKEFVCKCPGYCSHEFKVSSVLIDKLDLVRGRLGRPLIITSGTRCSQWNKEMGGKPDSAHLVHGTYSYAADLKYVNGREGYLLLVELMKEFSRIGIAKTFIHVDCSPYLDSKVIWSY